MSPEDEELAIIARADLPLLRSTGYDGVATTLTRLVARLTALSAERDSLLIRVERAEAALRGVLDWYGGPTAHPERWSECMIAARAALHATEAK